jgi:hypothetical protein
MPRRAAFKYAGTGGRINPILADMQGEAAPGGRIGRVDVGNSYKPAMAAPDVLRAVPASL